MQWHRRPVAALLAALGALIIVAGVRGEAPPEASLLVTASALPAGHLITRDDLKVIGLPPAAAPSGAPLTPEDVIGKTAAADLLPNSILQPGMLIHDGGAPPGRATVPITLAEAQLVSILRPGTRISLITIDSAGSHVLSDDTVVAPLPGAPTGGALTPSATRNTLVLLDVPAERAGEIAVLGQRGELYVVLGSV